MADASLAPRALPHDVQAEMGVLGSMLLSPDAIHIGRERLETDAFYKLIHQDVFDAILQLADKHNTVDLILLRDELKRQGKLDKVGGAGYLQELMEAVPTSANVEYYIEIVHEHAVRRKLIDTCTKILKSSYEDGQEVDRLLDASETDILAVRHQRDAGRIRDVRKVLLELMPQIDARHANPGQLTGLPTGFFDIDRITNGLQKGELIVIAARPSVGKTTLALNMLHHICMVERRPAALYSLEMRAEQIVSNIMCMHNQLDTQDFRRGTLSETQWDDIEKSVDDLGAMPLYIEDAASLTIGRLRAQARRMRHQFKVELIVVDYLQLVQPPRARDSRAVEVAEVSAGLKALSRELEIPVIAVSQLSRDIEKGEKRKPRMSDLRESGAIEQDADVIMLLHRTDEPGDEDFPGASEEPAAAAPGVPGTPLDVIVAKQRSGPTGICHLSFWKRYLKFRPAPSQKGV
jgi:replicative DNA helicase